MPPPEPEPRRHHRPCRRPPEDDASWASFASCAPWLRRLGVRRGLRVLGVLAGLRGGRRPGVLGGLRRGGGPGRLRGLRAASRARRSAAAAQCLLAGLLEAGLAGPLELHRRVPGRRELAHERLALRRDLADRLLLAGQPGLGLGLGRRHLAGGRAAGGHQLRRAVVQHRGVRPGRSGSPRAPSAGCHRSTAGPTPGSAGRGGSARTGRRTARRGRRRRGRPRPRTGRARPGPPPPAAAPRRRPAAPAPPSRPRRPAGPGRRCRPRRPGRPRSPAGRTARSRQPAAPRSGRPGRRSPRPGPCWRRPRTGSGTPGGRRPARPARTG